MKLELEPPFKGRWKFGYLRESRKDGRKRVDLFNDSKDRTTFSYARYKYCVNIGYLLGDEYEVDHIDNDKTNDCLSNLQKLTIEEHSKKSRAESPHQTKYNWHTCPVCGLRFKRDARNKVVEKPKCSRTCNGKASTNLRSVLTNLNEWQQEQVKLLYSEGKTAYRIAKLIVAKKSSVEYYIRTRIK